MAAIAAVKIKTTRNWGQTDSIIKSVRSNSARLAYDTARGIAAKARRNAPVRTGYLKASIYYVKIGEAKWRIVVGAPYGAYVNYGTRYMHAQPFFSNAVREQEAIFKAQARQLVHR